MELREQFVRQGSWLHRWRSYLPVMIMPLLLLAARDGEYFESNFGPAVDSLWESLCIATAFAGLALRFLTVGFVPAGTSGRNTRSQKAVSLNRTGLYSVVRHPIYVANYVIVLALLMFAQSLWLVVAGSFAYWLYYERIMLAEEEFLRSRFGLDYARWAAVTPAILPRLRLWIRPELPFSMRAVLAREYSTLLAVVLMLTLMDVLSAIFDGEVVLLDRGWLVFLLSGTAIYLVLRTIKKHTRWLHVVGR